MRRFTVPSLLPRGDCLEEEEEKEESHLNVSFSTIDIKTVQHTRVCNSVSYPRGGIVPFHLDYGL